jgi:hypothetical protein
MKTPNQLLLQFVLHLQCTQGFAAKANIAQQLQTLAIASFKIIVGCLINLVSTKTFANKYHCLMCKLYLRHHSIKQLLLETDASPPFYY